MPYYILPTTNKRLGITYTPASTTFRVWSPLRDNIQLIIYPDADSIKRTSYTMMKDKDGVHEVTIEGDLKGKFYTFLMDGNEVADPYSIASSINSIRSAIIDLRDTNPIGWNEHHMPSDNNACDPIIYEVHIKDFTGLSSSGVKNRGKYLGFVEENMLNHLKDLGVTHIHLMPVYDFLTVREDLEYFFHDANYNWGYDPELYNVPEGSYSSNPKDPLCRIRELKTLIMELHKAGLKVILDVVYNHTYRAYDSNFNIIMPGYYYRTLEDGTFSNGSGCGNELASERPMVRRFIIDSLKYWVEEYKVDGFRFDLMALIDIDTIEEAIKELRRIKPQILIYGEPWTGADTLLPETIRTTKGKQRNLSFSFFNDNFRNALKGDNDGWDRGFIHGNLDTKLDVETGIVGSIFYDDKHKGFAKKPSESINYLNSHDNLILTDKMYKVFSNIDNETIKRLSKLAFSILFTSQGIPFIHAGNEFLRSKNMVHNSYNSPLNINGIDWTLKEKNVDFYNYFRDLIKLRKKYREFRLDNPTEIINKLKFLDHTHTCDIIAYTISMEEEHNYLLTIHNGNQNNCYISKIAIKNHLNSKYGVSIDKLELKPILDAKGFVDMDTDISYDYGIEVPYLCTLVYVVNAQCTNQKSSP